MTPPRPLTDADRAEAAAAIARLWRGCCADVGLRGAGVGPGLTDDGVLVLPGNTPPWMAALDRLADELEDGLYLDIAREPGQPPRVRGWAMLPRRVGAKYHLESRLADIDRPHPAHEARDARLHAERQARRVMPAPDAKDRRNRR